jgi:hypothetical protein
MLRRLQRETPIERIFREVTGRKMSASNTAHLAAQTEGQTQRCINSNCA